MFRIYLLLLALPVFARGQSLPRTAPLAQPGDLAMAMVAGIDRYLERELAASVPQRSKYWKINLTTPEAYTASVAAQRQQLKKILGMVDDRKPYIDIEYAGGPATPSLVGENDLYRVHAIRWPVFEGVDGEGLLLEPKGKIIAQVVAIPDADITPEMLIGLTPGVAPERQYARHLAENGCRVVIPVLINRADTYSGNPRLNRWTNQPHREFIYRMAYEMGRHLIGYEVQKVLAISDWMQRTCPQKLGLFGYGEGGQVAFLAGALSEKTVPATVVSGYFGPRERVWDEPIYRNIWGQLLQFGDAEIAGGFYLATSSFPDIRRTLIIETAAPPQIFGPPAPRPGRAGAAPGKIPTPTSEQIQKEIKRAEQLAGGVDEHLGIIVCPLDLPEQPSPRPATSTLLSHLIQEAHAWKILNHKINDRRIGFDPAPRQKRQFEQLVAFTQKIWRDSDAPRAARFEKVDVRSAEAYAQSIESIRDFFWKEVIGKLPEPTLPPAPKSRQIYDTPKWTGHEITLDLYPDVMAYGILLMPKDIKPGEKRPVIVCQHGLEGRPQDICTPKEKTQYYNSFGAQLADRGYIVFAPQNPYIGKDQFRVLQRKANPLKLSLFSFIVRQHEAILKWLATLPEVDARKLAFYGLSYGGKTAMRVPAILPQYCLSICSGDFNEWIGKNVSVDYRGSYMFTMEYEMPEFDLGMTFNYAEMAYLIAPRPFMVERGHDDGVGIDEMVASEYAKVRYMYANRLKLPTRTEIEFFPGGHVIHGQGTFRFLEQYLK